MAGPLVRLRRLVRQGPSDAPGRPVDVLGRVGLVAYGVVHLLVAWLALQIAFGIPEVQADASGAVGTVARTPGGTIVLALCVVGMAAFVVWQLTAAAVGFRWVHGGERVRKRVGAVSKSVAITALCLLIVNYLGGLRRSEGDSTAQRLAGGLLSLPAGRVVLALGAATLVVIAMTMTYTGVKRTFLGDLDLRRVRPAARAAVTWLGVAGHLARALAMAVVGFLAGAAALFADPQRAGGLDAALRALAVTPLGAGLLVVVALGFAAFGLFCFADAATRRA